MSNGYTASLISANQSTWDAAVTHRFVKDLYTGSISSSVMSRYLIQDYRFADAFLALIGGAIATADTYEARVRFGQFAGMISSDEDTYFRRALDSLGVSSDRRTEAVTPDHEATKGFKDLMRDAAATRSYPSILAVLNVAEGLYLDWAERAPKPYPENYVYTEWITLHYNTFFNDFVAFLRAELDRVGPQQDEAERKRAEGFFGRAVDLELQFFDMAYE